MIVRLALVVVPGLILSGLIFSITVLGPAARAGQPWVQADQPVAFNHEVHVRVAQLDCTFCHRVATLDPPASAVQLNYPLGTVNAGYPEIEQCMFCHLPVTGGNNPEIAKVRQSWADQHPIDWVHIERMPDHVRFIHEPHLTAGLECATCHGDVSRTAIPEKVRPLDMGDCLSCHREMGARTECATCHY